MNPTGDLWDTETSDWLSLFSQTRPFGLVTEVRVDRLVRMIGIFSKSTEAYNQIISGNAEPSVLSFTQIQIFSSIGKLNRMT